MLALIAGIGSLPAELIAHLPRKPFVCHMRGFAPEGIASDHEFRLEQLGSLIAMLKERGVTELCMVGAIRRPPVDPAAIDAATLPLVPVIQRALTSGDDGALRAVIAVIEEAGIKVCAAHDLAPCLLPPEGCITARRPSDDHVSDAVRGADIVAAMAAVDVGQSCVVRDGQALAIEGSFGTDWMLASLASRPDGQGGLYFKAPKPGQDRRADLPTIGVDTIERAAAAGLDGVVIEAGGVIVLHQPPVIETCDRLGLFLWVRTG